MKLLIWVFPILAVWFPRQFPVYQPEAREELCEVIHVLSYKESGYDLEYQLTARRYITLQDRKGARGVINTGTMNNNNPLANVVAGDRLIVKVQHNQYFPLEMQVLCVKEIYAQDKAEPIVLAA